MYYQVMYKLAKQGHPWAQKEYDLMLKKMQKWVMGFLMGLFGRYIGLG